MSQDVDLVAMGRLVEEAAELAFPIAEKLIETSNAAGKEVAEGHKSFVVCVARAAALHAALQATAKHLVHDHGFPELAVPGALSLLLEDVRKHMKVRPPEERVTH